MDKPIRMDLIEVLNPSELETNRQFPTACPLVSRKFHIADIMALEAINPLTYTPLQPKSND